jgi:hypothetical protein
LNARLLNCQSGAKATGIACDVGNLKKARVTMRWQPSARSTFNNAGVSGVYGPTAYPGRSFDAANQYLRITAR